ncbi:hypothetical protein RJ035_004025 [Blastomyces gilchristii]
MVHLAAVRRESIRPIQRIETIPLEEPEPQEHDFYSSVYGSRFIAELEMPEKEMPREVAYRMIKDELSLNGNPILNLARFATTYAVHGTTYTGQYEDVQAINDLIVQRGIDCPIHVDAPSTGFVAPFVNQTWNGVSDLRRYWMGGLALSRVSPKERFNINYLGAEQASFTLNFSKVLHKSSVKRGYVP